LPATVNIMAPTEYTAGDSVSIKADIIDSLPPQDVSLFYRSAKTSRRYHRITMKNTGGYTYEAIIPAERISTGIYYYCISVASGNKPLTYPGMGNTMPWNWDFQGGGLWQFSAIDENTPLSLLNPEKDMEHLAFTRIGDGGRQGVYDVLPGADNGRTAIRLYLPLKTDSSLDDYTMSVPVKEKVIARHAYMQRASGVMIRARAMRADQTVFITLMEADGTSWSATVDLSANWKEFNIPLDRFKPGKGVLLPLGFPERWNYWVDPAQGRGGPEDHIRPEKIERVQLSLRPAGVKLQEKDPWMEVSLINITFE